MAQDVCPIASAEDRARLEAIVADRNRAQKHVARAWIIRASSERRSVAELMPHRSTRLDAGGVTVRLMADDASASPNTEESPRGWLPTTSVAAGSGADPETYNRNLGLTG